METINQSGAGWLQERVAFDKRVNVEDEYGNYVGTWVEQFVTRAQFTPRFGGEAVTAARLESRQPVSVRIRRSAIAEDIDTTWQMRDLNRADDVYQIRSITREGNRGMIELLTELGAPS